tara:strand:- start:527 stop:1738 length:1212 start_codon:yes stop_codon:yes gene_type:complete
MKILIFWEQDFYGGVDTHLLELLKTWPEKNDQITILTNQENSAVENIKKTSNELFKFIKIEKFNSYSYNIINFKLRKYKIMQYTLYFLNPILFILNLFLLNRVIYKFKDYDVILSNNGGYPASWNCISSIIVAKKIGIKKRFLLIHHESNDFFPFMKWFNQIVDKLVSASVTSILCVSKATRNSLLKKRFLSLSSKRVKVIYNSLKIKKVNKKKFFNLRKKYKISKKKFLIGSISRIEPYKGHFDLIKSISKIDKIFLNNVHFVFIGKGYSNYEIFLKDEVKRLHLSKIITFTGYIKEKSEDLISQLDLLINPTQTFEGYGLSILEAINCKVPVIATNVGAINEVFGKKIINIVPPKNIVKISKKIILFLQKPKIFTRKAEFAYNHFSKNYSPMSNKFRKIFS